MREIGQIAIYRAVAWIMSVNENVCPNARQGLMTADAEQFCSRG